jgi:hypothetical protein
MGDFARFVWRYLENVRKQNPEETEAQHNQRLKHWMNTLRRSEIHADMSTMPPYVALLSYHNVDS